MKGIKPEDIDFFYDRHYYFEEDFGRMEGIFPPQRILTTYYPLFIFSSFHLFISSSLHLFIPSSHTHILI